MSEEPNSTEHQTELWKQKSLHLAALLIEQHARFKFACGLLNITAADVNTQFNALTETQQKHLGQEAQEEVATLLAALSISKDDEFPIKRNGAVDTDALLKATIRRQQQQQQRASRNTIPTE